MRILEFNEYLRHSLIFIICCENINVLRSNTGISVGFFYKENQRHIIIYAIKRWVEFGYGFGTVHIRINMGHK